MRKKSGLTIKFPYFRTTENPQLANGERGLRFETAFTDKNQNPATEFEEVQKIVFQQLRGLQAYQVVGDEGFAAPYRQR